MKPPAFGKLSDEGAKTIDNVSEAVEEAVSVAVKAGSVISEGARDAFGAARDGIAEGTKQTGIASRRVMDGVKDSPWLIVIAVGVAAAVAGFLLGAVKGR